MPFSKTFYIENLGCAKNQTDAEALASLLMDRGWRLTQPEEAGLIIVNTCGFIEAAKKESLAAIMDFRRAYPSKKIVAAGCLAQRYGDELFTALPEADAVFGNRTLAAVTHLAQSLEEKRVILRPENYGDLPQKRINFSRPGSVYIKAAEGCGNHCAFCAIPLIRGPLRSRSAEELCAEIRFFLEKGVKEFNLVAQDLGSWGRDFGAAQAERGRGAIGLAALLRQILEIAGDFWLRLLYIHPEHFPLEVLGLCREDKRLLPYFDLPFQHASRKILRAMGRKNSASGNLALIEKIRETLPEAVLRSTFLVGFPGETDADFEELLRFQEEAAFDWLGAFTYSAEEGTPAEILHRKKALLVPKKTALARKKEIQARQEAITEKRGGRFTGITTFLLAEEKTSDQMCLCRAWFQAPEVDGLTVLHGSAPAGTLVQARLLRRNGFDMEAVKI
ncbi:MAG: 30S ribosomal protein S12 methylthiotransferase RimO [Spirochaetales bacterium]|jgi:ribosomal protein S12 methylthiotransferase|nr:30S ribosomal protein S12 methylthiotransferase RimO [Spirochaetales bacterium]